MIFKVTGSNFYRITSLWTLESRSFNGFWPNLGVWNLSIFKVKGQCHQVKFVLHSILVNTRINILQWILTKLEINRTGALSGAGMSYPSGAPQFTPGFKWGSCYSIFSSMCMFCRSLFVLFLLDIVLSVLRFMDSDYPFGIFQCFFPQINWTIRKLHCLFDDYKRLFYVSGESKLVATA